MQVFLVVCILVNLQSSFYGASACQQDSRGLNKLKYTIDLNDTVVHFSKDYYYNDTEAQRVCISVCGDLLVVKNLYEYKLFKKFVERYRFSHGLLISGTDKHQEGHWVHHANRQPMSYLLWHEGEPNGFEVEDCLAILMGYDFMYDVPCNLGQYYLRYACEVPKSLSTVRLNY